MSSNNFTVVTDIVSCIFCIEAKSSAVSCFQGTVGLEFLRLQFPRYLEYPSSCYLTEQPTCVLFLLFFSDEELLLTDDQGIVFHRS